MSSFIEIVSQYRLHVLIVVLILASSCVAHFYHNSIRSPKSSLVIMGTYILDDNVKIYFISLKKGTHRDLRYLITQVGRYNFTFAGLDEMEILQKKGKLPTGISVVSILGPSVLVIHVNGPAPHMMEETDRLSISVHDRYTRFAVVASCRIAVGSTDGKTSSSTVAA